MLTLEQMKTYRFIRRCILLEGHAPTYHRINEYKGRSGAYQTVTRIISRGWLKRRHRQIALTRDLPTPIGGWRATTTEHFDYFAVDYEHLTTDGWPRLVDLAVVA